MKLDRVKNLARREPREDRRRALAAWARQTAKAANTVRAYDVRISEWVTWADQHGVDWLDPTLDDARTYADALAMRLANTSCAQHISALRTFYSVLRQSNLTRNGVFQDVGLEGPSQSRGAYLAGEIERMLAVAAAADQVVILLAAEHGLRPHEILRLTWADVSHEHRIQARGRTLATSKRLDEAIHRLPHRSGYLVPYRSSSGMRSRMTRLCKRAGVPCRGIDALRRYAA